MITLFWTVAFCLGLRIVSEEGQLLYFIRKPFDDAKSNLENLSDFIRQKMMVRKSKYLWNKFLVFIGMPLILCITCMASIWGVVVFVALDGFNTSLLPSLILNCISASFIQTFIWSLYARHLQ